MWRGRKIEAVCVFVALYLAGCTPVDYAAVTRGEFQGAALVVWVGPANSSKVGDGKFLYVPLGDDALVFKRDQANNPSEGSEIIKPEAFYTDGGSIPRAVQSARGFNAWGYGPAYVIHDWLFVARKCLNDDARDGTSLATDEMRKLVNMSFQESANILMETVKALLQDYDVSANETVPGPVFGAFTSGPVSRKSWRETGACKAQQLSRDHQRLVDRIRARENKLSRTSGRVMRATQPLDQTQSSAVRFGSHIG